MPSSALRLLSLEGIAGGLSGRASYTMENADSSPPSSRKARLRTARNDKVEGIGGSAEAEPFQVQLRSEYALEGHEFTRAEIGALNHGALAPEVCGALI